MDQFLRRLGAVLIAGVLVAFVVLDLNIRGFALWWDKHAITTSIISSLLIVGATALIFDEVVARRQRRDRSLSVAAQALFIYGQAGQAYQAVMARVGDPSAAGGIPDELRDLASNMLVASPNLFDDPPARDFVLQLDRMMASLFALASGQPDRPDGLGRTGTLTDRMSEVQAAFQPLMARFPAEFQQRVRDANGETGSPPAATAPEAPRPRPPSPV